MGRPILKSAQTALRTAWPALVLLLLALWHTSPIWLLPDSFWYRSHENGRYIVLLQAFSETFQQGILYPRWLPKLMGGYGYPTFVFYQPLFFFLGLPGMWIYQDPVTAARATIVFCALLGLLGAYRLSCLLLEGNRALSLLFAFIFITTPYHGFNLFVRGDVSEYLGTAMCLWSVYALLKLADGFEKSSPRRLLGQALFASLMLAGLVYAHPFVALLSAPLLAALVLGIYVTRLRRRGWLILCGLVALMAVAWSSPYWFNLPTLKHAVTYERASSDVYYPTFHLQPFFDVINFSLDNARSAALPSGLYMSLAVLGWCLGRVPRWQFFIIPVYALYLFMMTLPSKPLWEMADPVLGFLQFSWRVLSVATVMEFLGILCLGGLMLRLRTASRWRWRVFLPVLGLVLLSQVPAHFHSFYWLRHGLSQTGFDLGLLAPYAKTNGLPSFNYRNHDVPLIAQQFVAYAGRGEFNPRTMNIAGLPHRLATRQPLMVKGDAPASAQYELAVQTGTDWHLQGTLSLKSGADMAQGAPVNVVLNQMAFPGWVVKVNGAPIPAAAEMPSAGQAQAPSWNTDGHGRIRISFPQGGNYAIEAYYDGPPHWQWRNMAVVLISLAAMAGIWKVALRRSLKQN